jgi:hypothetical protein
MHLNAETATQCLAQMHIDGNDYVMLPLRLSFGGSACPAELCIAPSEITTDLANRILNHSHRNPNTLKSKQSEQIPETTLLDPKTPFCQAKPMIVEPKLENVGKSDVYVDDICLVGVLQNDYSESRLKHSILLALDVVGRPIHNDEEPLPHDELASRSKLLAESGLSEQKCLLGWEFNTRDLSIKLSDTKFSVWSTQLHDILSNAGRTSKKTLEIIKGRLNHTASIIPITCHFFIQIVLLSFNRERLQNLSLTQNSDQGPTIMDKNPSESKHGD